MKTRIATVCAVFVGLVANSQAVLTLITSRGDIAANDSIDWGQFGADGSMVASGTQGVTAHGNAFSISDTGNDLQMYTQGASWNGNFAAGDRVIAENTVGGAMTIGFGATVNAVGMQVQSVPYATFTAFVSAFDGLGNLLGQFQLTGVSNANGDNSAIFLGVKSDRTNIGFVTYSVTDPGHPVQFGINHVSINGCNAVPEPATLAVLGVGAVALIRRKRN